VLFAASWQRIRWPYFLRSGGPGSALWKSTDGGETWSEVSGGGFPETVKGRIGIDIAPSDPRIIYAMVEAEEGEDGERRSGLYRSNDGGETWEQTNTTNVRPFYYSQVRIDPEDPERVYFSSFSFSTDGGRTVRSAALEVHVDHHAQWIDPSDPDRFITGNDGGIAVTFDRGGNYIFPNSVPLGQFYAISYDMSVPYRVCGGLQDNYSWCGPSRKSRDEITNHDWFSVSGGDGFFTAQDPRDPNIIYSESQGGNMGRLNHASGERITLEKPEWRDRYREYQDSIVLLWPDTTRPAAPDVRRRIDELRAKASRDSADMDLRYNWNTPFLLSPHNPDVFYAGANRVLKSTNRGEGLTPISPDLSRRDTMKIRISTRETGGITPDVTGAETHATIVALAESPVRQGMLFAGTDDGNVWISPDDGRTWNELTKRFGDHVPDGTYVSRIEPSHHDANRFYVTFDGHRTNDFMPYVFVTDDGGDTFRPIVKGLPTGGPDFVHVIREDPVNPDLLFAGTDVGAYVSLDRGEMWQRFMTGLPTVPVHDLKIHPRDRELIAGTHGRSIWIVDIAPLQQLTPALVASGAHLFEPPPGLQFGEPPTGGEFTGQLYFRAPEAEYGAAVTYWVGEERKDRARIVITDAAGDTIQTLNGPAKRGLHRVTWDFRRRASPPPLSPSERRDSIRAEARLAVVVDSLVKAGTEKVQVDSAVALIRRLGQGGGGGGGGGGGSERPDTFVARLAEGPVPGEGGSRGGGGGGFAALRDNQLAQDILRLVRGGPARGFRRGGGGLFMRRNSEPLPPVDAGTYTVSVVLGDRTLTRQLTVERSATAPVK